MSVALERIDGIESADVNLEEGFATIRLADSHEVSLEAIREVVRDNGFTPKAATVRAVGTLRHDGEQRWLALAGLDEPILLRTGADATDVATWLRSAADGSQVVIEAVVPETRAGDEPPPWEVVRAGAATEPEAQGARPR